MSRVTRWVIGAITVGLLALVAVVCLGIAAFGALVSSDAFSGPEQLTSRAPATVLDVDVYEDEYDSWTTVDVSFVTGAGERVVTWVDWPSGLADPEVDDVVDVAYDPEDPEWAVEASDVANAGVREGLRMSGGEVRGLLTAAAVSGGLALVAAAGTVVWARQAPRREPPRPAYGYPGHPGSPGYPGYAYGYPPQGYAYPPPRGYPVPYPPGGPRPYAGLYAGPPQPGQLPPPPAGPPQAGPPPARPPRAGPPQAGPPAAGPPPGVGGAPGGAPGGWSSPP